MRAAEVLDTPHPREESIKFPNVRGSFLQRIHHSFQIRETHERRRKIQLINQSLAFVSGFSPAVEFFAVATSPPSPAPPLLSSSSSSLSSSRGFSASHSACKARE